MSENPASLTNNSNPLDIFYSDDGKMSDRLKSILEKESSDKIVIEHETIQKISDLSQQIRRDSHVTADHLAQEFSASSES